MNRREAIIGVAAAAVAAPAIAGAPESMVVDPRIMTGGVGGNPHLPMVLEWCRKTLDEGVLYCHGDTYMDRTVRLDNPRFFIEPGQKVWSYLTGYTEEDGVDITIFEDGVEIGTVGIGSTHGNRIGAEERYYVRPPLLRYHEEAHIRHALGEGPGYSPNSKVGYDMRWLAAAKEKAAQ